MSFEAGMTLFFAIAIGGPILGLLIATALDSDGSE